MSEKRAGGGGRERGFLPLLYLEMDFPLAGNVSHIVYLDLLTAAVNVEVKQEA